MVEGFRTSYITTASDRGRDCYRNTPGDLKIDTPSPGERSLVAVPRKIPFKHEVGADHCPVEGTHPGEVEEAEAVAGTHVR